MSQAESGWLLGIDGGGSKTAGLAVDREGRVLGRARLGRSAIIGKPKPESCEVLRSLVGALCEQAGRGRDSLLSCGLGLNGIDFEDEFPVQHADLAEAMGIPAKRLWLVNDGIVALWGASAAPTSLIIQHGSGFTAACRSDFGREELFDHLHVGDVLDMRYRLTAVVGRMILGMVPTTPLKEATLAAYGVEESRYCESVYRHWIPSQRIRNTVPLIFEAWEGGDPAAAELVEAAVADYALAARAMIARTGSDRPAVVLGGGQLRAAPQAFWDVLTKRIREHYPHITAAAPQLSPECGAVVMAGFRVGVEPTRLFARLLTGGNDG